MNTKKKILVAVAIILVAAGVYKIYDVYFNYRFQEITEGKVYKSGVIPPEKIAGYVEKHGIKTIIDLRGPVTKDTINNPEQPKEIVAERNAANNIPNLNYVNIPSQQVPSEETLKKFFAVMDNQENYPVLIHCYHGIGRAQMYSALYRIEYEGWAPDDARRKAAFPVIFSSFDDGTPKGEYLKSYKPRRESK